MRRLLLLSSLFLACGRHQTDLQCVDGVLYSGGRRVSFFREPVRHPRLLADGRVLVSVGRESYTLNPDGTWPEKSSGSERLLAPGQRPRGRPSEVDLRLSTGTLVCYDAGRAAQAASVEFFSPEGRLGRSAVEADGSFFVELPADRALRLRASDRKGKVLGSSGWFWLRPGETRSCAGCHEGPRRMAENRLIQAITHDPRRLEAAP